MNSSTEGATEMKWLARMQKEIDDHVFFWTTAVVVIFVVFTVPQVVHIWRQAQPEGMGALYLAFLAFIVVIVLLVYVPSLFTVLRPLPMLPLPPWIARWLQHPRFDGVRRAARSFCAFFCWLPEKCCCILPWIRAKLSKDSGESHRGFAIGCVVLAVAVFFLGSAADGSRLFPLAGVFCRYIFLFALLTGAWLWFPSATKGESEIGPAVGRLISWAACATLLGEIVWLLAAQQWFAFSYRLYSIWAFCHASILVLLVALLLDRMHEAWDWPLRPVAITLLACFVLYQGNPELVPADESGRFMTREQRLAASSDAAKTASKDAAKPTPPDWRVEFFERIKAIPEGQGPVVLVAASGGGSRAAIFASLCLELLARTPIAKDEAISSKRGEAAVNGRSFADNIVLISSVSGGSLASADFVSERANKNHLKGQDTMHNSTESELAELGLTGVRQQLDELAEDAAKDAATADKERPANWKNFRSDAAAVIEAWRELQDKTTQATESEKLSEKDAERLGNRLDEIDRWLALLETEQCLKAHKGHSKHEGEEEKAGSEPKADAAGVQSKAKSRVGIERVNWVLHSRNFDRMCTDFMAPLMRGLLSVDLYRGDALARFWTEVFEWHGASNLRGPASGVSWPDARHLPCVIYNATDVAKGRRLAIGLPPLPNDLWDESDVFELPERLRPASLSSIAPSLELALARTVRMSSNFPFGFRVQEVRAEARVAPTPTQPATTQTTSKEPSTKKPDLPERVRILDGGVVDNTGIDTLFFIAKALRLEAQATQATEPELVKRREAAKKILDELARRGVLLLEIDAGAKPDDAVVDSRAAAVVEPFNSLNNAAYSQAERSRQYYLEQLPRLLRAANSRMSHIVLRCNHVDDENQASSDVMTAWSLGPRDKAEVLTRFFGQITIWDRSRKDLMEKLQVRDEETNRAMQRNFDRRAKAGTNLDKKITRSRP